MISTFGKTRPVSPLDCIQKNHPLPESIGGASSTPGSPEPVSLKQYCLCITTHVQVWWTNKVLWASSSRVQRHSLCAGLMEVLCVSQTSVIVHICVFNLFQSKLLSASFQPNGITSHLGQTKTMHGKQLPGLPQLSWHMACVQGHQVEEACTIMRKRRMVGEGYLSLLTFSFWNTEGSGGCIINLMPLRYISNVKSFTGSFAAWN